MTEKGNSSTIKRCHLQFKSYQQLIQICDLSVLEIQTNATDSVWNNRLQKTQHAKIFSLLHSFPPLHVPLLHPQHITEWNAACNYPLSNQLESTLNHLCGFGLSQLSVRALSGLSTAEPRLMQGRQRRIRAGGEPGCCLRGCCCCRWLAGRMRSGHWQQAATQGSSTPGASAIRIHNAGLVIWKGSRSSSSKPSQIICYITSSSSPAPLNLSPTDPVTHDWTHSPNTSPTPYSFLNPGLDTHPPSPLYPTTVPVSAHTGPVSGGQWLV